MDANKLTERAQDAILAAQRLAEGANNPQLEPEHLLLTLVEQRDGVVPRILERLNVSMPALRAELGQELARLPKQFGAGHLYASARFNQVLARAREDAERLKDEYLSVEHLLLGLVEVD